MFDHEYAKELVNREFDGPFMADFFNKYKDELNNVKSSRKAIYIVVLLLGDNIETARFVSKQYELFYETMCHGDCNQCEYSKNALKKEKGIEFMSCFTYYILSILLNEI